MFVIQCAATAALELCSTALSVVRRSWVGLWSRYDSSETTVPHWNLQNCCVTSITLQRHDGVARIREGVEIVGIGDRVSLDLTTFPAAG